MGRPAVAAGIILQARMGSTRLPGKILRPVGHRPLLGYILDRLQSRRHDIPTIVATTTVPADDVVEKFCADRRQPCFRGPEQDVLARYYECAREYGFDVVVRLTGDNPFVDVEELDRLIDFHADGGYDFSGSFDALPVGVGAEVFTFAALERSHREGHAPHHREHVDEYILEHPELFTIGRMPVPDAKRRPDLRLTVDTPEDLARAHAIAERLPDPAATTEAIITLCSRSA